MSTSIQDRVSNTVTYYRNVPYKMGRDGLKILNSVQRDNPSLNDDELVAKVKDIDAANLRKITLENSDTMGKSRWHAAGAAGCFGSATVVLGISTIKKIFGLTGGGQTVFISSLGISLAVGALVALAVADHMLDQQIGYLAGENTKIENSPSIWQFLWWKL
ncbi:MAG: hypothetical protein Q8P84_09400 [Deltaproteobacteria bacterium]|nr:hypothetical protein [Deltaproteobacteria bacterium]